MSKNKKIALAVIASIVAVVVVAFIALAWTLSRTPAPSASSEPVETTQPAPVEPEVPASSDALMMLSELTVSEPTNRDAYNRDLFPHWSNMDGCTVRIQVLVAEAEIAPERDGWDGCSLIGGQWVSLYDGDTFTNPSELDIDHMVPLAEAWQSGASAWTTEQREAYANDLGYEHSLIAVSAGSNRSKSDQDPTTWMPELNECFYGEAWVSVKWRWSLTIDPAEQATLTTLLTECASAGVTGDAGTVTRVDSIAAPAAVAPVNDGAEQPVPAEPAPAAAPADGATDPRLQNCGEVQSAGYGPYQQGTDPEYDWYRDGDGDGWVCE